MQEHDHMGEWAGEIRRGKALGLIVAGATITDADGKPVDLAHLNADGTINEAVAVPPVAEEVADETPKAKRKKAPAPSFDEAAAATKAKKSTSGDEE